jgi:hypothetical protein
MKADIEGKLSRKINLYRKNCAFGDACACPKPIVVVVDFVESGQHHEVNLYQGPGRANAMNWTREKTRDNSWAHETGHLLDWYDEYAGGAVADDRNATRLTVSPECVGDLVIGSNRDARTRPVGPTPLRSATRCPNLPSNPSCRSLTI